MRWEGGNGYRIGVFGVGKVMVLGMAISLEMAICFFLLGTFTRLLLVSGMAMLFGGLLDRRSWQSVLMEWPILEGKSDAQHFKRKGLNTSIPGQ
jgi:hypothetical protein